MERVLTSGKTEGLIKANIRREKRTVMAFTPGPTGKNMKDGGRKEFRMVRVIKF